MAEERTWQPAAAGDSRGWFGRSLSVFSYPMIFPFSILSRCESTVENARWWRLGFLSIGVPLGGLAHYLAHKWCKDSKPSFQVAAHSFAFLTVDHTLLWCSFLAHSLIGIFKLDRSKANRVMAGKILGPRIVVIGNGPSALEGEPRGHIIDQFDEVVRFNNFQTKTTGMEAHVGKKTTVHYSDGTLFPTYSQYHAPGASIILSLIMDRFIVAGTYVVQRAGTDLQLPLTFRFLNDPTIGWMTKERIELLKKNLGLQSVKHPTSGMLAIDHFVRQEGVQLPVYIHGFDFFQGPKIHYFSDQEPIFERLLDKVGVNQHSPLKEKVYVERLVAEGKVRFLKDM